MKITYLKYNLLSLSIILTISVLVSFRDYSIGADTLNYVEHYILNGSFMGFEPSFRYLIKFFNLITLDPTLFFGFICFLVTIFYYKTYEELKIDHKVYYTLILFSLLLFSSWYINAITNGLRQGIALAILYYALVRYFLNKEYFKFIIFLFLSISFHYSIILVVPFFILYHLLSFNKLLFLWFIVGVFYIFGINEIIFYNLMNIFGQNEIYLKIKNYSGDVAVAYYGFNWSFFIYTILFPLISMTISYLSNNIKKLPTTFIKIYLILCLPYFICGFANYSNRYAVIAWFFLPLIQLSIIKQLNFSRNSLQFISVTLFCFGIIYFYLIRINYLGVFF